MKLAIRERELIQLVHSLRPIINDQQRAHQIKVKGVADFVTQVDLAVQHTLAEVLGRRWPGIQFMGEEETPGPGTGISPCGFWTPSTAPPI